MKFKIIIFASIIAGFFLLPQNGARAGDCFQDPIYELNQTAKVIIGARVRDVACMEGSVVLKTLTVGKLVHIIGSTDGWFKVEDGGVTGWVGMTLVQITDAEGWSGTVVTEPVSVTEPVKTTTTTTSELVVTDTNLTTRLKGYILLQVQQNGEAWFVDPVTLKRYYLKDGPIAYEMMRAFGLGITNADLNKVLNGDTTLISRLKGRILLQVESHGEAYYVNPKDGRAHYMKDGAAAYEIMRYLSLGITDADLYKIPAKEFVPISSTTTIKEQVVTAPITVPVIETTPVVTGTTVYTSEVNLSSMQLGIVPSGVDMIALQKYWLNKINQLREERGLRLLELDQRFIDTATEWAGYMGENDVMTHTRPDGSSMHKWIDSKGLDFTVRNSTGGWVTNYFTENIAWGIADGDMSGVQQSLDETLAFYLSEADVNGPHYRTIYHPDWNTVGLGLYFKDRGDGSYKISQAFHYGSLQR